MGSFARWLSLVHMLGNYLESMVVACVYCCVGSVPLERQSNGIGAVDIG